MKLKCNNQVFSFQCACVLMLMMSNCEKIESAVKSILLDVTTDLNHKYSGFNFNAFNEFSLLETAVLIRYINPKPPKMALNQNKMPKWHPLVRIRVNKRFILEQNKIPIQVVEPKCSPQVLGIVRKIQTNAFVTIKFGMSKH